MKAQERAVEEQNYDATKPIESLPNLLQKLFERVHDLERRVKVLEGEEK